MVVYLLVFTTGDLNMKLGWLESRSLANHTNLLTGWPHTTCACLKTGPRSLSASVIDIFVFRSGLCLEGNILDHYCLAIFFFHYFIMLQITYLPIKSHIKWKILSCMNWYHAILRFLEQNKFSMFSLTMLYRIDTYTK
jgi:hypothetical protein